MQNKKKNSKPYVAAFLAMGAAVVLYSLIFKLYRWQHYLIAAAVALQSRQYDNELLCFFQASRLRISAPKDMDWTLDGEFQSGAENIDIQNLHNAVRLILPRG